MIKIAIDIDNTIFTCNSFIYQLANKLQKINNTSSSYKIIDVENVKKSNKIIKHLHKIFNPDKYQPHTKAIETINYLHDKGFEIHIVSNRPTFNIMVKATVNLLESYGVKYNKLVLGCKNKVDYCNKHNIFILINDMPKTCEETAKNGIKTIIFNPENQYSTNSTDHRLKAYLCKFSSWDKIKKMMCSKIALIDIIKSRCKNNQQEL